MRILYRLTSGTAGALAVVGVLAILMMMLHIVADVTGKYVFGQPIQGTLETVSAYYMVAVIFLPLAYVSDRGDHIIVELFTRNLPPRRVRLLDGLVGMITLAFVGVLCWAGFLEAVNATAHGEAWETATGFIEVWPSRWFLPLGWAAMAAFVVWQIANNLRAGAGGARNADG